MSGRPDAALPERETRVVEITRMNKLAGPPGAAAGVVLVPDEHAGGQLALVDALAERVRTQGGLAVGAPARRDVEVDAGDDSGSFRSAPSYRSEAGH
ncbi:hypothetical protein [Streptomyces sp. NPDC047706]|uniref:hypothetical protein n=1 Tax=Streptomyces sp. NPDC047706 TaxID=3365486 RepID=UPI003719CB93